MAGRRLVSVQAQSIRYCRGAVPGDCCPESGNVGVRKNRPSPGRRPRAYPQGHNRKAGPLRGPGGQGLDLAWGRIAARRVERRAEISEEPG
jgi:hypothetical protein